MPLNEQQQAHIKKQVEFYFSDSNLPFDKFLFESVTQAEDGWLDLSVIVAFKRMQQILKTEAKSPDEVPSEDVEEVGKLLKDSTGVEISEDGYQIRRRDMPSDWEAVKAAVDARSVHAEPLPHSSTIESVGTLFAKHGEVRQVRLQRFVDPNVKGGVFAGAVIVEMGSAEGAQKLVAGSVQHEGATLRIQTKAAYQEARQAAGLKDGQRDLRSHCPEVTTEGLPEDPPEADGAASTAQESAAEEPYDEGCFVHFEVQGEVPDAMPQGVALRNLLGGASEGLAYVDYNPSISKQEGKLRFNAKENADACLAKAGEDAIHSFELAEDAGTLKLKMAALTGEEEATAWRNYRQASRVRDAREDNKGGKRRGGHQGRGGSKRGRH